LLDTSEKVVVDEALADEISVDAAVDEVLEDGGMGEGEVSGM
jgi:hypothetical protein